MKNPLSLRTVLLICLLTHVCLAQQFGKNNVQYTYFDWHYVRSQHFDVYFYPGGEGIAEFVSDIAESSYASLSNRWGYRLRDRIVFVVYKSHNDFGQSNLNFGPPEESVGGFTEFFKNRIVIPYEGSYEQLRHVTHHELAHAVLLQMMFGQKPFAIIAGLTSSQIPLWFIEGLAEYESRRWDSESDMFVRDAVISGYLPPINRLYGFLAYKGGQSVFDFIQERYGDQKVGEILRNMRSSNSFHRGLQKSLGIGVEELNGQWQKHLKQRYWPDFAHLDEPGDFAKQVTFHNKERNFINNSGELSPQGDKIAYLSDKSGFFDIYMTTLVGEPETVKLVSGQRSGKLEELHWLRPGIAWSPNGDRIAFAAKSREQDALHIVDVERRKIVQSHKFGLDGVYSPDWSPTGDAIVFAGVKDGQSDLYVYRLETQDLTHITDDIFSDFGPRWSPSGRDILFVSDRGPHLESSTLTEDFKIQNHEYHRFDVYIVDAKTGSLQRLTATSANEKSPVWSPDGHKIAFVSDRSGISNIFVKDLAEDLRTNGSHKEPTAPTAELRNGSNGDTNSPSRAYPITNILTGVDHLSWRGQKIAFTSFYKGGFDVFVFRNPMKIAPDEITLSEMDFWNKRAQGTTWSQSNHRVVTRVSDSTDATGADYRRFVFGDAFKRGQPLSAHQPDPQLFQKPDLKEDGSYRIHKYQTKFSPDIITGGAGFDPFFGFQGAATLSFSDLMGRHRINLVTDVFLDVRNSDFAVSYFYLPKQTDYGIGLFHFSYLFLSQGQFVAEDNNLGLNLSMSRPLDRYHRLEIGTSFRLISRQARVDLAEAPVDFDERRTRAWVTSLAYVKDNVLWGQTGPKAGNRFRFFLEASSEIGPGNLDFRIYQFDYRRYLNFKKNYTFAFRVAAGFSEGRHRQKFFLGGVPNWINLDFRDDTQLDLNNLYFSNLVTPLRGFDYYEQVGSKFFLTNLELRLPLIDYFGMRWPLPIRLSNIRGTLFTDIGSAWDGDFQLTSKTPDGGTRLADLRMSFGWGLRANLGIFLLRYDVAWRTDLNATSGARHLFSLGADL